MKNGKYLGILAMAAMFEGMSHIPEETKLSDEQIKNNRLDLENRKIAKQEELKRNKGLKKFRYGDNVLWAINEKVANKKALKKGFLTNAQ